MIVARAIALPLAAVIVAILEPVNCRDFIMDRSASFQVSQGIKGTLNRDKPDHQPHGRRSESKFATSPYKHNVRECNRGSPCNYDNPLSDCCGDCYVHEELGGGEIYCDRPGNWGCCYPIGRLLQELRDRGADMHREL